MSGSTIETMLQAMGHRISRGDSGVEGDSDAKQAARFAAKEAVSKAFGTGIGKARGWRDIDVHKKESGEPFLVLHGGADRLAKSRDMKSSWITLSHTDHHAMAMIVIEA